MIWDSLIDLISGKYGLDSVSGPIGMTELVGDAIESSWQSLLYLMVVISINLGFMNLLPIPALDGGRLLFLFYEAITRKPINKNVEGYINFIGIVILLIFMAVVAFKDLLKIF
jgi:regulator of sigma E protease